MPQHLDLPERTTRNKAMSTNPPLSSSSSSSSSSLSGNSGYQERKGLKPASLVHNNKKVLGNHNNNEGYRTFTKENNKDGLIRRPLRSQKINSAKKSFGMELIEQRQQGRHLHAKSSQEFRDEHDAAEEASSSSSLDDDDRPLRTIDEYLQDAVDQATASHQHPWKYWLVFMSLGVANSSDATEILCLSYILADDKFKDQFLMESSGGGGAGNLAAAVFLGMLIGGLWVGTAGDVYGRRPVLLTGCCVNAAAGILASGATHLTFLTLCRLVAGLGIGATVPPLFTLCSELAPPSHRGFWVAVVASFWMVGSLFVALLGFVVFTNDDESNFVPAWRIFLLLCALPSMMGGLSVAANVPESPRFLALRGQHMNAARAAQTLATKLRSTSHPWTVRESEAQFAATARQQPQHHASYDAGTTTNSPSWRTALVELYYSTVVLYTKELCQSMLGLQIVWGSLSFGSYGLATWINSLFEQVHLQNIYFNAILFALSNLPGNLLTAYFLDSWGRQSMLTASLLAASVSLAVFGYAAGAMDEDTNSSERSIVIVAAACSFQAFTIAAWNTIDVLTAEVFPTSVRSTAVGLCAATGRLAAMFAQLVNGALIAQPARLLATSAISLAIGATVPHLMIPDRTGMAVLDSASSSSSSGGEQRPGGPFEETLGDNAELYRRINSQDDIA